MHCALNYFVARRFDMASRRRLFHQEKRKSGNTETTWKKLSVKAKCSASGRSLRMNLVDVAITQKPTKFINSNLRLQEKTVTGDDFFLLLGHLLEKKNRPKEAKEYFPVFSLLSYFVLALFQRAYSATMKCVIVGYFKANLCKILSVSFSRFFEMIFF